ncbi:MAG: S-adenosylmethionine:tRNA ribosyltransferase-isomerase, partial [Chloroflexota bacterium]
MQSTILAEHPQTDPAGGGTLAAFRLPPHLEAGEPPEARGLARDEVRLLVSEVGSDRVQHLRFRDLPDILTPGDLLVINTSGTMNASLGGERAGGQAVELHLSTQLPGGLWTVEVREPVDGSTRPLFALSPGETISLPAGGVAAIHTPYDCGCGRPSAPGEARVWVATLRLPALLGAYLTQHGKPIRYGYVRDSWPAEYYQTVYAT